MRTLFVFLLLIYLPTRALAQQSCGDVDAPPTAYQPITPHERVESVVTSTVGPLSLGVGLWSAGWQTVFNSPVEWGHTWEGMGKRYVARVADVALVNTLEVSVGAIWGEEPRYIRSNRKGFWPRTHFAAKTVFLAQRRDGHLAPAWGRYIASAADNVIENSWLPPSVTTPRQTVLRSANEFLGRFGSNLWKEFWPDVKQRLAGHR